MRRSIAWLVALGTLGWGGDAFAAKKFQGMIEYKFDVLGENAALAALIVPTSVKVYVRGNDTRVEMAGGMMGAALPVVVRHAKEGKTYTIAAADAQVTVANNAPSNANVGATSEKQSEVLTIDGYECQKYTVRQADGSTADVWTTDKLAIPAAALSGGATPMLSQADVPGMVMKVSVAQEGLTVVLTAVDLDFAKPAKSLFVIPKDYAVVPAP